MINSKAMAERTRCFISRDLTAKLRFLLLNTDDTDNPRFHEFTISRFFSGPDQQRKKSVFSVHGTEGEGSIMKTKYFISDLFEIELSPVGNRALHYIMGGDGLAAIVDYNGTLFDEPYHKEVFYILKDHLGSWYAVTDETGHVATYNGDLQIYNFDPWGCRRNAISWTYDNVPTDFLFDRGFTGHEHLDGFGLINMNGRVYDPLLARFLSPDPIIQAASYGQNYNRYSYCLNNPLKYVDPSGYLYLDNMKSYYDYDGGFFYYRGGFAYFNSSSSQFFSNNGFNLGGRGYYVENGISYYNNQIISDQEYIQGTAAFSGSFEDFVSMVSEPQTIDWAATRSKRRGTDNILDQFGTFLTVDSWSQDLKTTVVVDILSGFVLERHSEYYLEQLAAGDGGVNGLTENNFVKYSIEGTSVWAGTIQTGFDAARKLQPTVTTWIKGAKVLGKTSNILGVASIGYDFATGTANSSTIADGLVLAGGAAAIFFGSVALAPWVAGVGVIYGIVSIAGGEAWLDRNIDISKYINIVKPSKP